MGMLNEHKGTSSVRFLLLFGYFNHQLGVSMRRVVLQLSILFNVFGFALPALAVVAPAGTCAQVQVVGARGTGEPSGFGYLLGPIATYVQSNARQTVGLYALPYPADFPYAQSEAEGVYLLENYLRTEAKACPSQTFVLLGYSQGAQVVADALSSGVLNSLASKVVAITGFGDPTFNSAESFDAGSYTHGVNGLLGARPSGALKLFATKLQSYCNGTDGICQNGQTLAGHLIYQVTSAGTAESYILGKLQN